MLRLLLITLLISTATLSCTTPNTTTPTHTHTHTTTTSPPIRNIILMIGDGMGPQQLGLLEEYATRAPHSIYKDTPTSLRTFINQGSLTLSLHSPMDRLVTDSACSASQLATGVSSPSEAIGLNERGDPATTILEHAQNLSKSTGLVSDTRITHATPAAFAAHISHRSRENDIATQLLQTQPDILLSGGLRHFLPKSPLPPSSSIHQLLHPLPLSSKRSDERNLLKEAQNHGYTLTFNRSQLLQATSSKKTKILGLFASSALPDAIEHTKHTHNNPNYSIPTLADMTSAAITTLNRNPNGFFLMVEGGQIDWAAHANDAGSLLHEMIRFDNAAKTVLTWAQHRNDTLVIITADHETGGFGLSYSKHNLPSPSTLPGSAFKNQPYHPQHNFGPLSSLDLLYNQSLSLQDLFDLFDNLPKTQQTPQSLSSLLQTHTPFTLSPEAAKRVLSRIPNPAHNPSSSHSTPTLPHVHDFFHFYPFGEETRIALLARELAAQQNVVWSTGTHTHTPVPVILFGPDHATAPFRKLLHHTDLGTLAIQTLLGPQYTPHTTNTHTPHTHTP